MKGYLTRRTREHSSDKNFIIMISKNSKLTLCLLLVSVLAISSCTDSKKEAPAETHSYPAMPGFNKAASDSMAIALAGKVMKAMGGYESWKDTRYIAWTFLGRRRLIWDKFTGDVRINSLNDSLKIILNIHSMNGKVMKSGELVTNSDSLQKYIDSGRRIWINDSYWLVMPFKMKDSGVTLAYMGEDSTKRGQPSHVVALTYKDVGVTPENKFHVWIDKKSLLVTQWAYYREAEQDSSDFIMPWLDYKKYGEIMLSGNRGRLALTDIMVLESVPEGVFSSFEPVNL